MAEGASSEEVEHEDSDTSNEVSEQKEEVPHMEVRRGGNKKKFSGFVERTLMPALEVKPKYAFFAKYQYVIIPLQDCIIIDTKCFFPFHYIEASQLCRRRKLRVFSVLPLSLLLINDRYVTQRTIMGYEIAILAE